MLVATAGHIDHGKTSLIRALTGVETDKLPEEKARGISIDLGFAYWRPEGSRTIGFIDVPGHERFVRNMLAGVGGVDFALLVVAADDGVMPQSVEHVQILDLLGVRRGFVAITKCDRASRERIDEVRAQVATLLAPTVLAGAAIFEVSAVTGAGVGELGEALRAVAAAEAPHPQDGRLFRLAIDKAFSVTGAGTVVSGTVLDGMLEAGARLVLSPSGLEARVRGLQSGGKPVENIGAGERCAVNLAGVELSQVRRGDWLLTPKMHAPTTRIEARIRVLAGDGAGLKHKSHVHLHIGTADIGAMVLIRGQAAIAPGTEAIAQLVLDEPTSAATGDRFVLRDPSGRHSLGGGAVVDPFVPARRRPGTDRAAIAQALQQQTPIEALKALMAIPGHEVDTLHFERCFDLSDEAAEAIYHQADAVLLGSAPPLALPADRLAAAGDSVLQILKDFHRAQPDEGGMAPRDLKARLSTPLSSAAFVALQRRLADERLISTSGALIKLAGHTASLSAADEALWRKLQEDLEDRDVLVFTAEEVTGDLRTSEVVVRALLNRMRANGEIWRITDKRLALKGPVAALAATAAEVAQAVGGQGFTAAQYRDALGIGRTLAIQFLEFFDRIGVTYRNGDLRKMRADYTLLVGSSRPYASRRQT